MRLAQGAATLAFIALVPLTATAGRERAPRAGVGVSNLTIDIPPPPNNTAEHDQQRVEQGNRAAQQVIAQGQPEYHHGPPPPHLEGEEIPPADWLDLGVYYGILIFLVVVAVAILYRYLAFRFSLETPPLENPTDEQPERRPAPAVSQSVGLRPASRAPPPARPAAPTRPGSDPRIRPPAAPPPPVEMEAPPPPKPRPPPPAAAPKPRPPVAAPPPAPSPAQLQARAVKMLSGTEGWVTAGGMAKALQADAATLANVLDGLVDSGQVQEAKAQNGQTVYRFSR